LARVDWFAGKKVLLVGGSEGIGRATAVELARRGADVLIAARRPGPLAETLGLMKAVAVSRSQRLESLPLDVTDRAAVKAAVDPVLGTLAGLDVLVLAVGAARPGYVDELGDEAYDAMLAVNYLGHVHVARAFLPHLLAQGRGDICFLSSMLGFAAMPGWSAYAASKYAIAGFAESLALELAPRGIRVTVFYPGTTDTPGLVLENREKPAAVWAMESGSSFNTIRKPEVVARSLLGAIERGRLENFPGLDVWFVWFMTRRFPRLSRWLASREWAAARVKSAGKEG
jgi:NAD(P)-dependent dehydrogenase (short-subunit alcohol dehydrogenase family)